MLEVLFLLLILTIFLLWIVWNYKNFIKIYVLQVIIILAFLYILYHFRFSEDIFILLSFIVAIVIRLVLIPWFLYHFINKSKLPVVEREFKFWIFTNLLIYFVSLLIIIYISQKVYLDHNYKDIFIFVWALFMLVSGFLNFSNHKKLIWDILSFLELENGVFLLSLLVLEKVGFYIELWIIVDILMSFAILIISTMKIKSVYGSINIDKLSELKD